MRADCTLPRVPVHRCPPRAIARELRRTPESRSRSKHRRAAVAATRASTAGCSASAARSTRYWTAS
eukprot:5686142-Pyramimonas_sp.AAC.1